MQKITKPTRASDIKRDWYLIDAKDKVLGRIATEIANLLMGKKKPYFVRNLDCGDYVVVIHAEKVHVSGKKEEQKIYKRFSGYPAGLRKVPLKEMRERKPTYIIQHAASGMLPKNRLHDRMLKRLYVFPGEEHPYGNKIKNQKSNIKNTN